MKVFISWSGDRGLRFATALAAFLRRAIQAVDPFVSREIDKGARWRERIATELETSTFGVVCVTRDSISSEWLHFEAGALSARPHLWTFLLDVTPADLRDPIAQFQHTVATDQADVFQFFGLVNEKLRDIPTARPLRSDDLRDLFDRYWPDFERALKEIPETAAKQVERTVPDMFGEIMNAIRGLRSESPGREPDTRTRELPLGKQAYWVNFKGTVSWDEVATLTTVMADSGFPVYSSGTPQADGSITFVFGSVHPGNMVGPFMHTLTNAASRFGHRLEPIVRESGVREIVVG
jgi:hypothetical protein